MRQAITTLSVLAVVSFAFSTAVALTIASTIPSAAAASDPVTPAVNDATAPQCPASPQGAPPQCPALKDGGPSLQTVVEAARRAGCPAFSRDVREAVVTTTRSVPDDLPSRS
jgi:hypothetical protein